MKPHPLQHKGSTSHKATQPSFPLFPSLPTEIQQEIWLQAASAEAAGGERIHRIAPNIPIGGIGYTPQQDYFRIINQNPVPSLLQVSRDSRCAAKRMYELWPTSKGGNIFVCEDSDILYFADRSPIYYWFLLEGKKEASRGDLAVLSNLSKQLRGARHLALDDEIFALLMGGNVVWAKILENLETLTIILQNHAFPRQAARKFRDMPETLLEYRFNMRSDEWLSRFGDMLKSYHNGILKGPSIKIAMSVPKGGAEGKDEDYWAERMSLAPWATSEAEVRTFLHCGFNRVNSMPPSQFIG